MTNKQSWEEELENKLRNLVIDGWQMGKEQKLMPYDYRCNSDIAKPVYDYIKSIFTSKAEQIGKIHCKTTGEAVIREEASNIVLEILNK